VDNIKCILAIVERGKADRVVKAAKEKGLQGLPSFMVEVQEKRK